MSLSPCVIEQARRAGENLLVAGGYADAFGLPFETRGADEIRRMCPDLSSLQPTVGNAYFGSAPPGTWSDDTALSLAVAQALVAAGGFSMDAMVAAQIAAMNATPKITRLDGVSAPRGWGDSTWQSLGRVGRGEADWNCSGNARATGNGVLIKLAPLALWQALRGLHPAVLREQVEQFTRLTHASAIAAVTALTHAQVLRVLVVDRHLDPGDVPGLARDIARRYEREYPEAGAVTSDLLQRIVQLPLRDPESIIGAVEGSGLHASPATIGLHASEALAVTYGIYADAPDYQRAITWAVLCGGDTDSIAAMVASMAVLGQADVVLPDDVSDLQDLELLRRTGQELAQVVTAV